MVGILVTFLIHKEEKGEKTVRTTSLKTVYLTEQELKEAIVEYLVNVDEQELAEHLEKYATEMAWAQDGEEFIISMDGEVEDKKVDT